MKKVSIFLLIFILFFISSTCVLADGFCTPTEAYKSWLNLSDEEKSKVQKPHMCKEAIGFNKDVISNEAEATADINENGSIEVSTSYDSYYNSIEHGYVMSTKNQYYTGGCWTFASTSMIETLAAKEGLVSIKSDTNGDSKITSKDTDTIDLSEMHMLYGSYYDSFTSSSDFGKVGKYYIPTTIDYSDAVFLGKSFEMGGNEDMAASYLFSKAGIVDEETLSFDSVKTTYTSGTNSYTAIRAIDYSEYKENQKEFSINDYFNSMYDYYEGNELDFNTYLNDMKARILKYGSVGINIYVSKILFNGYSSSKPYFVNTAILNSNHAVTVVGWDDSIKASNFKNVTTTCYDSYGNSYSCTSKATHDGAWIVKNSWGADEFGTDGLFYVSYDSIDAEYLNYNFVGIDTNKYDYTYQSSKMVGEPIYAYDEVDKPLYQASLFTLQSSSEVLEKVSFATTPSVKYTVYVADKSTWQDSSTWKQIATNITQNYFGIKSVILDNPVVLTSDYAIIVKSEYEGSSTYFPVMYSYKASSLSSNYYDSYYNELNTGESFSSRDTTSWKDLATDGDTSYGISGLQNIMYTYTVKYVKEITDSNFNVDAYRVKIALKNNEVKINKSNFEDGITTSKTYKILDKKGEEITTDKIGTGMQIYFPDDDVTYKVVLYGDINGDGQIRSNDALFIQRHLVDLDNYSGVYKEACDVNGDGRVRSNDALFIQRYLVELDTNLGGRK